MDNLIAIIVVVTISICSYFACFQDEEFPQINIKKESIVEIQEIPTTRDSLKAEILRLKDEVVIETDFYRNQPLIEKLQRKLRGTN